MAIARRGSFAFWIDEVAAAASPLLAAPPPHPPPPLSETSVVNQLQHFATTQASRSLQVIHICNVWEVHGSVYGSIV